MAPERKKIGPYEIQGVIGSGGMGVVYRAVQPALKRYVAIKILPANLAQNKEFVERFLREARSVAALDHPGIVTIYDIGQCEGAYYFVMKLLVGDTLEEYIAEEGRLPLDKALLFAGQLADALGTAHKSGVIHRDVKPANIIVDPRGEKVVLTDFGIALTLEETRLTRPGTMFGSPIYIAPEQLEDDDVDHRADFYSLGSVLFQMLAGCPPYDADMPVAILHQRISDPEKSVRDINPEVPPAVDRLVSRLMARNPDDRYQSAGELLEALQRLREQPDEPLEEDETPAADEPPPTMAVGAVEPAGLVDQTALAATPPDAPVAAEDVSPPLPEPPPRQKPPRPGLTERFGMRRIILAWIGAMAILLAVLLVVVWWTRDTGPQTVEEGLQAQLGSPGEVEEDAGETAGEDVSAVVEDDPVDPAATTEEKKPEQDVSKSGKPPAGKTDRSVESVTKPAAEPEAAGGEPAVAALSEEPPEKEKAVRPTEVGSTKPAGNDAGTQPARTSTPARKPAEPVVSEAEVAAALTAVQASRQAAQDAGAAEHAPEPWAAAEKKLREGEGHRAAGHPDLERQAYGDAEALFVQAGEKAAAESARLDTTTNEAELAGLETRIERGITAGTVASLEDAGQALARFREIAPGDARLERYSTRYDDTLKRLWQSHGITRSFSVGPGVEMDFVWIPPGTFRMGTMEKRKGTHTDESPKHTVVISKGFWLGTYEVTQAQWQAVMGGNPSRFKGSDRPVDSVSWNDARAFVDKLNSTAGAGRFRLPTEAEWEFTCRAGTSRSFFGGEINTVDCRNEDHLAPWGWYCYNSGDATHPVGQLKPNAWGLYDMHGNVGEWCSDYYDRNYYEYSSNRDPGGPDSGKTRVLRGGGWDFRAWDCRSAYRGNYRPTANNNSFGLRIVRTAD